jgi:hypothetical protein
VHTNAKRSLTQIEAMIGEPLRDFLFEQYNQQGLSFREISLWLSSQGISVSRSTLNRWYYQLCGRPRSIEDAVKNWWGPM